MCLREHDLTVSGNGPIGGEGIPSRAVFTDGGSRVILGWWRTGFDVYMHTTQGLAGGTGITGT